ncbi:MAG: glycosyltransferase family 2 protein [Muribaculaceae bacterium]|nr:glycosyltransferase family 2 protein [Muribaculaceae bacterium]
MWVILYYIFSYIVFFYTLGAMIFLVCLAVGSYRAQKALLVNQPDDDTIRYTLKSSPITPSVSIIAPAYNEEKTILDNVYSLLGIYYPNYDIIIVNDGSKDKTLDLLIEEFKLVKVPFINQKKVTSKPIKAVYKSTDEQFSQLTVVDKEPGGHKSDSVNAGLNVCYSKYFVNTDVDCIIEPMALYRMMWPIINSHDTMIGVGATMLMLNGCIIEDGRVVEAKVSNNPLPAFQQLEYMRSFLVGKMGWSSINTLPNISGGFGLFDTDVVIKSGGYDPVSFAEDVDMLLRMVTYMENSGRKFRIAQIPQVCCWTEGPFTPRLLFRQRIRWARGLCEIVSNHRKLFFNYKYKKMGAMTLPYIFTYEFMAPIIEATGFIFMIWLVLINAVNWNTAFVIFGMIYFFSLSLTFLVLVYDFLNKTVHWKSTWKAYLKLIIAGITEPILYHPFTTVCSLIGYFNFLRNSGKVWKPIRRKGAKKRDSENSEDQQDTGSADVGGDIITPSVPQ